MQYQPGSLATLGKSIEQKMITSQYEIENKINGIFYHLEDVSEFVSLNTLEFEKANRGLNESFEKQMICLYKVERMFSDLQKRFAVTKQKNDAKEIIGFIKKVKQLQSEIEKIKQSFEYFDTESASVLNRLHDTSKTNSRSFVKLRVAISALVFIMEDYKGYGDSVKSIIQLMNPIIKEIKMLQPYDEYSEILHVRRILEKQIKNFENFAPIFYNNYKQIVKLSEQKTKNNAQTLDSYRLKSASFMINVDIFQIFCANLYQGTVTLCQSAQLVAEGIITNVDEKTRQQLLERVQNDRGNDDDSLPQL